MPSERDIVAEARKLLNASNAYTIRIQVRELLGELADEVERLRLGSCLWKYDPDGYWQTGCGEGFTLSNEESLSANAFRFCHACGKRIEELVPGETNE